MGSLSRQKPGVPQVPAMAGSEWQKSGIPWRPRGRVRPFLAVHVCVGSVESKPSEPDAKGKGGSDVLATFCLYGALGQNAMSPALQYL